MMVSSTTNIRVRYADTDQMKHVYYSKYLEYFEQGRSDLLRQVGMPYPEIENMGYYLPVVEAHAKYRQPARYDELLEIKTILREVPAARIRLEYEVTRSGDSTLIAEGYTVHSIVNARTGRPVRAPRAFVEALTAAFQKATKAQQTLQEV
jgi:acyl-CoA thioester hydrolase